MKLFQQRIFIVLLVVLVFCATGYGLTADEILQEIEEHRLIRDDFEMTIQVNSFTNQRFEGATVMKGYVKNGKITDLVFLEPDNMKGRKLVIKENDMWLIFPKVKNPVRISASQRLMGGISYGDIAALSYVDGYNAKLDGLAAVTGINPDGSKTEAKKCLHLELTAKNLGTNYNKINLWAEDQSYLPVKADFLALSGKKMTTVYYTAPKDINGKLIISKLFLFDQVNTAKHFSLEYYDIK